MKSNANIPTEASSKAAPQQRRMERAQAEMTHYLFTDRSDVYGEPAVSVDTPSGSGPYLVTSDNCTCRDHAERWWGTMVLCKHRIAAQLMGFVEPTKVDPAQCSGPEDYAAKHYAEVKAREIERHAEELEAASGLTWFPPTRPTDEAELAEYEQMLRQAWRAETEAGDHDAERSARRQWGK